MNADCNHWRWHRGFGRRYELEKARAAGSSVEYTLFEARDVSAARWLLKS